MADKVLDIFSVAEPDQLPHVVSSPSMLKADPDSAITHLTQLEASGAPSITLSLCIASLALRKGDLHTYRQQMDRHAEVLHEEFCTILNILLSSFDVGMWLFFFFCSTPQPPQKKTLI